LSRLHGLRKYVAETPGTVGGRFRARRWEWFAETFPDIARMRVIDLGGTARSWVHATVRPESVLVVNLSPGPPVEAMPDWLTDTRGDACELPPEVLGGSYDLVFSNSVLEHVGGHYRREQFAESVHKLADRHWVQAPYRYFPLEPHWMFPGFAHLPVATRTRVARLWKLGMIPPPDRRAAVNSILKTELPSRTEMRYYFPDSQIRTERVAGLPKSLIAVKT
jgi:hypothetical protein